MYSTVLCGMFFFRRSKLRSAEIHTTADSKNFKTVISMYNFENQWIITLEIQSKLVICVYENPPVI